MIVITSTELGWDCVVAVYPGYTDIDMLKRAYPREDNYVIHEIAPSNPYELLDIIEERGK